MASTNIEQRKEIALSGHDWTQRNSDIFTESDIASSRPASEYDSDCWRGEGSCNMHSMSTISFNLFLENLNFLKRNFFCMFWKNFFCNLFFDFFVCLSWTQSFVHFAMRAQVWTWRPVSISSRTRAKVLNFTTYYHTPEKTNNNNNREKQWAISLELDRLKCLINNGRRKPLSAKVNGLKLLSLRQTLNGRDRLPHHIAEKDRSKTFNL